MQSFLETFKATGGHPARASLGGGGTDGDPPARHKYADMRRNIELSQDLRRFCEARLEQGGPWPMPSS